MLLSTVRPLYGSLSHDKTRNTLNRIVSALYALPFPVLQGVVIFMTRPSACSWTLLMLLSTVRPLYGSLSHDKTRNTLNRIVSALYALPFSLSNAWKMRVMSSASGPTVCRVSPSKHVI
jgi:hypothetical protein